MLLERTGPLGAPWEPPLTGGFDRFVVESELLAGNPLAAEMELRKDYEALERMGDRYYRSTLAGMLAEALYQQARYDELLEQEQVILRRTGGLRT